ncbi:MAG: peptide chain release factor N(5)-glutamine methyltransferase [Firmicutes bacterium]|nr:peptide chain release factor N(5)-glutamine methyltransferase [Bacillota bacterium]
MNIEEFLQEIIRAFKKAGIECAEAEARQLACHVLSCDLSYLILHSREEIDDKVLLASAALINERCKGRPLQYVLGTASFYGIDLAVDERVLIPRPETELLAERAIAELKERPFPKVMDLCTGSGAIAAAVAANVPNVKVIATELSPRAFMLARVNLRPYANVKVLRGDLFEALESKDSDPSTKDIPFDAILTNPPYIPSGAIDGLAPEVKDHEPHMALDGGKDGLDIIKRIIAEAPAHFKPSGFLLMEIGDDQADAVMDLVLSSGAYRGASILKDLAQKDRMLMAQIE